MVLSDLQTLPPAQEEPPPGAVGKLAGFSLHAGVAAKAHQRDKLERLARDIARPALSEKRLSLTAQGNIRTHVKTPYRDGTTHLLFEPLDVIASLAALVPHPRIHRTRFQGVFAPNRTHRAEAWARNDLPARFGERVWPVDSAVAVSWGFFQGESKQSLPVVDGLIAAIARVRNLTLATRNTKDFARFDIPLLNPW